MQRVKGVLDVLREEGDVTRPPLLYKYRAFDQYTQRIFENNEVHFSSPRSFNDPFDSMLRFIYEGSTADRKRFLNAQSAQHRPDLPRRVHLDYAKRIRKQGWDLQDMAPGLKNQLMDLREQMGVFCMTQDEANIVMWSHYASRHTGFCIGFRTDLSPFSRVRPVDYDAGGPASINVLALWDRWDELTARAARGLLTKAADWSYEHEWRIVDSPLSGGVGTREYQPEALADVILGCRVGTDDKRRIIEWCRARNPRPILHQAKEKEREFGLDIVQIPY